MPNGETSGHPDFEAVTKEIHRLEQEAPEALDDPDYPIDVALKVAKANELAASCRYFPSNGDVAALSESIAKLETQLYDARKKLDANGKLLRKSALRIAQIGKRSGKLRRSSGENLIVR